MAKHYNIAVLGGGPGGYVAALKAAQSGASTALIEKHHLGGTCLNYGCIPSKALLASAELVHHLSHAAEMGVELPGPAKINWPVIQARKDKILATLRNGIKALLTARKATIHSAHGTLAGPGKIAVKSEGGQTDQITADNIIIATGSVPSRIPGWPTDPERICTSDESLHWKALPKRLLIVGGGVIGCEFACMMQPLGVAVTIVEALDRLLPNLDPQLGQTLAKVFAKRGIAIHVGVKIDSLAVAGTTVKATLGDGTAIEADKVLVATGRRPNTAEIGLASVGITADRGFVRVDDRMQTPVKGHYCIGDANGRCLLAHAASAHGIVAVENALGHNKAFAAPVPNCVYTFPEIGTVGLSADEARAKGMPVFVGTFPLNFLGKAMAANDNEGFVKTVRHRETGELLGVHMLGHTATECIAAAGALLHTRASVHDVAEVVFAHPTMSEAIKESAEDALGMGLHVAPRKVLRAVASV